MFEPGFGGEPEVVVPVDPHRLYPVLGEGGGVTRLIAVNFEGVAVVLVEAVFGGEPEESFPVLHDFLDGTLGEPLVDTKVPEMEMPLSNKTGAAREKEQKKGKSKEKFHPGVQYIRLPEPSCAEPDD